MPDVDAGTPGEAPLESTALLLARAREGDAEARERLFRRVLPSLRRWAHQRLPRRARDLHDTEDLVQITLMRSFERLDLFESRGPGAFLGYLRTVLLNAIRDELRRIARRPARAGVDEALADPGPSVLEEVMGRDALDRYERSLAALPAQDRESVILRVELDLPYQEIASLQGRASADAARMAVARALVRLAEGMRDER